MLKHTWVRVYFKCTRIFSADINDVKIVFVIGDRSKLKSYIFNAKVRGQMNEYRVSLWRFYRILNFINSISISNLSRILGLIDISIPRLNVFVNHNIYISIDVMWIIVCRLNIFIHTYLTNINVRRLNQRRAFICPRILCHITKTIFLIILFFFFNILNILLFFISRWRRRKILSRGILLNYRGKKGDTVQRSREERKGFYVNLVISQTHPTSIYFRRRPSVPSLLK